MAITIIMMHNNFVGGQMELMIQKVRRIFIIIYYFYLRSSVAHRSAALLYQRRAGTVTKSNE